MTRPWPDEVRAMVDALMHGGACPSVIPISGGGWRVYGTPAYADYDEQGRWWFDGSFRSAAFVLAELLQRSDTTAPAQTLSNRILVAVPTARTQTTDDGIEVSVGSKSVRWKREKNGWSLGDDLFTSDERVIEHAKAMAAEASPQVQSVTAGLIKELVRKLSAEGLLPQTRSCGQSVFVSVVDAGGVVHECELRDGGWYFGETKLTSTAEVYRALLEAATPSKPVAPQPSPRALDTDAAMQAASNQMLRARQQRDDELMSAHIATRPFRDTLNEDPAAAAEAAMKLAHSVTVNVNASLLAPREFAAAVARAIDEQSKREKAHAAKGTTMTTKTQALIQTATADASEAAWRTAGSQFVKLAREPLVGLLTRHLAPNDDAFRARLAAFLETELGTALLASMLSATLSAMPQTTGEVPQKLARELRVRAMADAGDVMADVLMGPLRQVMALYLQDPAGAPAAAPALDAPQSTGLEWATQGEKVAK